MCSFNIPFSGSAESLVPRAKTAIENAGGSFAGNEMQGNFQVKTPIGNVAGDYQLSNQEIYIKVLKKPFLLSCKRIEKELREVLK